MNELQKYIRETLGIDLELGTIDDAELDQLPFYIAEGFNLYRLKLLGHNLILAENNEIPEVQQIEKQFEILAKILNSPCVLYTLNLPAAVRRMLIKRGINFIVPGKQLYLPALFTDLRETFQKPIPNKKTLLPSAQVILLYSLLHKSEVEIEQMSFKEIAEHLNYSQMGITKAVNNLVQLNLLKVEGTKEKYLRFNGTGKNIWDRASSYFVNPVIRQEYVDYLPENIILLNSNTSALPRYSAMNESRQQFFALDKGQFFGLKKSGLLNNLNKYEGKYCLEIWKYDPKTLTENGHLFEMNVDPLSLYLSLRDYKDERIEMALDKIIDQYIW